MPSKVFKMYFIYHTNEINLIISINVPIYCIITIYNIDSSVSKFNSFKNEIFYWQSPRN